MRKLLLFFVLATFYSCIDIQYDGAKRLVFQTVVKDGNGNTLPNTNVEITVSDGFAQDLISKGKTNQNGEITLLFPAPKYSETNINLSIYNDDASYLWRDIFNIWQKDFVDYKFVLPNANLLKFDETAPLQLSYNQTGFNTQVTKVRINGIYHMEYEVYNQSQDEFYPLPYEALLKKNQSFQLKYTVLNTQTGVETEHVVDLTIGTEALNYTVNY